MIIRSSRLHSEPRLAAGNHPVGALTVLTLMLAVSASSAFAHHGKEFLVTASSRPPDRGDLFLIGASEYQKSSAELTFEPGLLYGITDIWSAELHTHIAEPFGNATLEAIGLEQRFHLYGDREDNGNYASALPLDLGILFEVEHGMTSETPDAMEFRWMISHTSASSAFAFNLTANRPLSAAGETIFSYAVGARQVLTSMLSVSLEMDGTLHGPRRNALTPGVLFTITHGLTLQFGSSFSVGPGEGEGTVGRAVLLVEL